MPVFPLHATHPAQHDGNAFAIGAVDHGFIRDLQLPTHEIEAEVLYVTDMVGIALRIVFEEKIGCVIGSANQVVTSIYLHIEVPATCSDIREAFIIVAALNNFANAEINFL